MKPCSTLGVHQVFTCHNNPKGNAETERMMRALKEELLWLREWRDPYEVLAAMGNWIESYNDSFLWQEPGLRGHSALQYKPPNQAEETYDLTTRTRLEIAC